MTQSKPSTNVNSKSNFSNNSTQKSQNTDIEEDIDELALQISD